MSEQSTLKAQVAWVLENVPASRNSDRLLTWEIWRKFYGIAERISWETFRDLPSEGSINRIRRWVQNRDGLFPPTDDKILEFRKRERKEWMRYFRGEAQQGELRI